MVLSWTEVAKEVGLTRMVFNGALKADGRSLLTTNETINRTYSLEEDKAVGLVSYLR